MEKDYRTFRELNISFQPSSDCVTCDGLSCHNNVTHKNGQEYNVHISTDELQLKFNIFASLTASSNSNFDIEEFNLLESEAVKFICDSFNWFECR